MHSFGAAQRQTTAALHAIDDEDLAGRSTMRLLISASTASEVQAIASRVHVAGLRGGFPFREIRARDLPSEPAQLEKTWTDLIDGAAGGSVLITGVEEMPPIVQEIFIAVLAHRELARTPSSVPRLMAGTTVSLVDRIGTGTFSARLFYRLNVIHLIVGGAQESGPPE